MYEIKRDGNRFYIGDKVEAPLAEMTFVPTGPDKIIVDGTYVSDTLKGQGIGKILLKELTQWARSEGKKIIPLCPYVKAQMEKNDEYSDLIHK